MKNKLLSSAMLVLLAYGLILTSCGPSAEEVAKRNAIRSAPSVEAVKGLKDKLTWLEDNAQSGGNYVIEIDGDEKESKCSLGYCTMLIYDLSYKNKNNITITLKGIGANRTIYNRFNVDSGVTLILDDNITLRGGAAFARVYVSSGGTLVMNDGSAIIGAINSGNAAPVKEIHIYGAGVHISDKGTFIMKGGTISGNTILPEAPPPQAVSAAGIKAIAWHVGGGGVYVNAGGTFIKTGGIITGYASDPENGNVVKDDEGKVLNGFGHAVLFGGVTKAIDTTIDPEMTLHFSNGVLKEGKKEQPASPNKPVETQNNE